MKKIRCFLFRVLRVFRGLQLPDLGSRAADLEIGDAAGWETCATAWQTLATALAENFAPFYPFLIFSLRSLDSALFLIAACVQSQFPECA